MTGPSQDHDGHPASQDWAQDDPLTRMFRWWNAAYRQQDGFNAEAFSRHFTEDAVMRINGHVRGRGPQALAAHFQRIQVRTTCVQVQLPFHRLLVSADGSCIFTAHRVWVQVEGRRQEELVMGYAEVVQGRLSRIDFVSAEGIPEPF